MTASSVVNVWSSATVSGRRGAHHSPGCDGPTKGRKSDNGEAQAYFLRYPRTRAGADLTDDDSRDHGAPSFALGVADVRAGRGFHPDYAAWDDNQQWDYERGRQWARFAPPSVSARNCSKSNQLGR